MAKKDKDKDKDKKEDKKTGDEVELAPTSLTQYEAYKIYLNSFHSEDVSDELIDDDWELIYGLLRVIVLVLPLFLSCCAMPFFFNCHENPDLRKLDQSIRIVIAYLAPYFTIMLAVVTAAITYPKMNADDMGTESIPRVSVYRPSVREAFPDLDGMDDDSTDEHGMRDKRHRVNEVNFRSQAHYLERAKNLSGDYRVNDNLNLNNPNDVNASETAEHDADENGGRENGVARAEEMETVAEGEGVVAQIQGFANPIILQEDDDDRDRLFNDGRNENVNDDKNVDCREGVVCRSRDGRRSAENWPGKVETDDPSLFRTSSTFKNKNWTSHNEAKRQTFTPFGDDVQEITAEEVKTAVKEGSDFKKPAIQLLLFLLIWTAIMLFLLFNFHYRNGC